ncbi:MAG: MotA/TolQ/ExbB proton channel family protein, partial [Alphaproteobacteria bacterium]|nr:MotA/TolQ/ExbB proton channel family protein [Alphaproteobacteria bacterium]
MLQQGGILTWIVAAILVFMLFYTLFILATKFIEQNKVINQGKTIGNAFWSSASLSEAAGKLGKDTAYRQIVDDGLLAQDQHTKLTDSVDSHEWTQNALARSQASINSDLNAGLAFLATVGSTAPFIGLFGTVV